MTTVPQLNWQGAFADYVRLVQNNPAVARDSHSRVYDMISSHGYDQLGDVRSYRFFTKHLFGIDRALQRLVEGYFLPAARGLDVRRRILLMIGPVGAGKSTIAALLKHGLEEFSRTDAGAMYCLAGCPLHEEPLHLVPTEQRAANEHSLGVRIEGHLCPVCQQKLQEELHGAWADFPVQRFTISENDRVGIGTFQPSDPGNQDIAELVGSINLAAITQYGVESNPKAYCFDGELNVANRGILEMQEMLKCDERFLWRLLSLAQEGCYKTGRYALISADEVVVAHCNTEEYRSFAARPNNEALLSRLLVAPIPYAMDPAAETKIYAGQLVKSQLAKAHAAPYTLDAAAMFSVATRLSLLPATSPDDDSAAGMHGLDPRFVINCLCSVLAAESCGGPHAVLESLGAAIDEHPAFRVPTRQRLLALLQQVKHDCDTKSRHNVQKAVAACMPEVVREGVQRYMSLVQRSAETADTDAHLDADDLAYMQEVEEHLGIGGSASRMFRMEMAAHWQNTPLNIVDNISMSETPIGAAITELLLSRQSKLTQPEHMPIRRQIIGTMVTQSGYCPMCADATLDYVLSPYCL